MESRVFLGEHDPDYLIGHLRREFLGECRLETEEALGVRVALLYFERHCLAVWFVPVEGGLGVSVRNHTRWSEALAAAAGGLGALALGAITRVRNPLYFPVVGLWCLARGVPKALSGFRLQGRVWSCLEAELQ